jgi:hypothetical protein
MRSEACICGHDRDQHWGAQLICKGSVETDEVDEEGCPTDKDCDCESFRPAEKFS